MIERQGDKGKARQRGTEKGREREPERKPCQSSPKFKREVKLK